jgi:hypothetical protein
MATTSKKTRGAGGSSKADRIVVYRGVKIAPMAGKRSKTAMTLRKALTSKSSRGRPAHA